MQALPMQFDRSRRVLHSGVGPKIVGWLADPEIIEIMLNPDGQLWIDRLGKRVTDGGECLSRRSPSAIIRLVSRHVDNTVHAQSLRLSAELPGGGERFEGLIITYCGGALLRYPRIDALSEEAAIAVIENPATVLDVEFEADAVSEILRVTERYPYFLQQ